MSESLEKLCYKVFLRIVKTSTASLNLQTKRSIYRVKQSKYRKQRDRHSTDGNMKRVLLCTIYLYNYQKPIYTFSLLHRLKSTDLLIKKRK